MYDVNGNRIMSKQTYYPQAADVIPIVGPNQTVGMCHSNTGAVLKGPDQNVMMIHQQAMDLQIAKEKKLQSFQKRTKLAAKSYIESVKTEEQQKSELEKKEVLDKKRKVKEFEEKVKSMRKSMKTKKPVIANPDKSNNKSKKPSIQVTKVQKFGIEGPKDRFTRYKQPKAQFGSTSMRCGDTDNKENTHPSQHYPTYLPITDCAKPKAVPVKGSKKPKLSKLQQITAMSVAVPMVGSDDSSDQQ